jgi:hypothetical protein
MSLYNNLVASSALAVSKVNEFNFDCAYPNMVALPKAVNLSRAVINNCLFSFRPEQLSFFISTNSPTFSTIDEYKIINGYYDTVAEFITMLNNLNTVFSAAGFTFSFSNATESLKITNTQGTQFVIKGSIYNPYYNLCKRLGFNLPQDYKSYAEGTYQVVYASSPIRLLRTTGFYLLSNLCTVKTASPNGFENIIDFIPIETQNLKYGDLIVWSGTQISKDLPQLSDIQQRRLQSNSQFNFQLLDDELQSITDQDKSLNTQLFLNFDYN